MNGKKSALGILAILLIFMPMQYLEAQNINPNSLVGTWELESVENFPLEIAVSVIELFDDGTGMQIGKLDDMPYSYNITWQLRGGNRLQMTATVFGIEASQIHNIELSERGTLLTCHIDGFQNIGSDEPGKSMYRKR